MMRAKVVQELKTFCPSKAEIIATKQMKFWKILKKEFICPED